MGYICVKSTLGAKGDIEEIDFIFHKKCQELKNQEIGIEVCYLVI